MSASDREQITANQNQGQQTVEPSQNHEPVRDTQSELLLRWQRQLTILVLSLLALILLYVFGIYFSDILRILALSVLFSYLFINVVDWLEQYTRNRAISILIVYLVVGALTAVAVVIVVPAVVYQITQLIDATFSQIPQWIENLIKALRPLEVRLHAARIPVSSFDILSSLATNLPKPDPAQILARMTDVAMSTMTWLFYALSVIVLSFYFLLDGHQIKEGIIAAFPKKRYAQLELLAGDMDRALQSFFRGQIVLAVCFGAAMLVVYMALGVHYALLLAVFLGVLEIVPVIGPTVGFIPTVIAVALDGMDMVPANRLAQVVIVTAVFFLVQWIKDNVVAPKYMGNVIGLHPVMIFIAIMVGAKIDGVCGIIWSLPVACVVNVFVSHMAMSRHARISAQNEEHAEGENRSSSLEEKLSHHRSGETGLVPAQAQAAGTNGEAISASKDTEQGSTNEPANGEAIATVRAESQADSGEREESGAPSS